VSEWRWRPWLVGWVAHTAAFTAVVFYERHQRQAGLPAIAVAGAADADRFAVAVAGPAWPGRGSEGHVERYTIRGSLDEVRAKLAAALERRQLRYEQQEVTYDAAA
jgi:hypothetical protein